MAVPSAPQKLWLFSTSADALAKYKQQVGAGEVTTCLYSEQSPLRTEQIATLSPASGVATVLLVASGSSYVWLRTDMCPRTVELCTLLQKQLAGHLRFVVCPATESDRDQWERVSEASRREIFREFVPADPGGVAVLKPLGLSLARPPCADEDLRGDDQHSTLGDGTSSAAKAWPAWIAFKPSLIFAAGFAVLFVAISVKLWALKNEVWSLSQDLDEANKTIVSLRQKNQNLEALNQNLWVKGRQMWMQLCGAIAHASGAGPNSSSHPGAHAEAPGPARGAPKDQD